MKYNNQQFAFIIGFIVVIVVTSVIISLFKKKKTTVNKKELVNNNEFVLKNKDKIEAALDLNAQELKSYRIRTLITLVFFVAALFSFVFIDKMIISVVLSIIMTILFGINFWSYSSKNNEKFDELVQNALHEFDSDLNYEPTGGFTESEYKTCLFPEVCDRFSSEDMITNIKKGFCYSDVLVESEHEDSDNHTYYTTEYRGSLARINLKNSNCKIYLGSTARKFIFGNNNYKRIKFENDEFNEMFRACSDNELLAYKLLTPDIMEEFINIKKNTYGDIDIRILNDKLYIRFLSGDTFDSRPFAKETEKKELLQSIAILEEVMKTMDKVKNIIDSKLNN